jgi:hypothetical protein
VCTVEVAVVVATGGGVGNVEMIDLKLFEFVH